MDNFNNYHFKSRSAAAHKWNGAESHIISEESHDTMAETSEAVLPRRKPRQPRLWQCKHILPLTSSSSSVCSTMRGPPTSVTERGRAAEFYSPRRWGQLSWRREGEAVRVVHRGDGSVEVICT